MNRNILLVFVCSLFFVTACKTKEKPSEINYMQNAEQVATEVARRNQIPSVEKGDQLMIIVTAKDMDVVRPFNQNYYTTPSSTNVTAPNSEKPYLVDSEGEIDFPVLGKIPVNGKTLEAIKQELYQRISRHVKNPTITIRLTNFKVTVLGEVARPGQITIPEGQTTLLNAIGLVGDVTMYAKRDNLLVIRNVNGELEKARVNLMDANFFNSPYFQLKQNDVIYVSANYNKEKIARQDPNANIYIAVAGMVIGLAGIFITIFKK